MEEAISFNAALHEQISVELNLSKMLNLEIFIHAVGPTNILGGPILDTLEKLFTAMVPSQLYLELGVANS